MKNPQTSLPPGFRFHPTDEELILHYLRKRVISTPLPVSIIAEVDIYKFDPWDLPAKATFGEKEWYFFSPRDRKYPNGARPNRAAASGYWKATGTDKTIVTSGTPGGGHQNIGVKKALVFYKGRPPKGVKTNWIMHEYRLAENPTYPYSSITIKPNNKLKDSPMRLDDWVLCRIYKKTNVVHPTASIPSDQEEEEQFIQDALLPILKSGEQQDSIKPQKSSSFSNLLDAMDYSILSSFLADCPGTSTGLDQHSSIPGFNAGCLDHQTFFNGYPGSNSGSHHMLQKLPQLQFSAPTTVENRLKRQLSTGSGDDHGQAPPKKYINSCSFINSTMHSEIPQNNFMNQLFLNQQYFLSPELQFQG